MSDHSQMEAEGATVSNWLWAVVAAVVAAVLTRWLGDVSIGAALLMGVVVFAVYAVLLAQFWEAPYASDGDHGHHDHGHADHGHAASGHGHDDHSHATALDLPAQAPAMVSPDAEVASAAEPAVMAASPAVAESAKPQALTGPRGGKADNLQEIEGIGPALEKLCHEMGIYHFDQIASWGASEIGWMDGNLKGFKGRVTRDKWVAQARIIAAEGVEAFRIRAKSNDY